MTLRKWRIEKIHPQHPAHINNPDNYRIGGWYITNDPHDEHIHWSEGFVTNWSKAFSMIKYMHENHLHDI